MGDVKIDIRTDDDLQEMFDGRDLVSIEDLIDKIFYLNDELDTIKEKQQDEDYGEYQYQCMRDREAEDMIK